MLLPRFVSHVPRVWKAISTVDVSVERTVFGWAFIAFRMSATTGIIIASFLNATMFMARSMDIDLGGVSLLKQAMLYPAFVLISLAMYAPIYASYAQRDFERRRERLQSPNLI